MKLSKRFIGIGLAALAALVIGLALFSSGTRVPNSSILVMELSGELPDAPSSGALPFLGARSLSLPTLILQLDKTAADSRVVGVLLHIRSLRAGYAQVQELRDAIARVRDAGKKVVSLIDTATLNASGQLYLASAADQVYLVPAFLGPFAGVRGEFMSLGGFFEKVGIDVEYARVGKFKSGPEMFANREMSQPARENAHELIDGLYGQMVAGIAHSRSLSEEKLHQIIDSAPSTGRAYLEAGLADGIADRKSVLEAAGLGESEEVELGDYLHVDPRTLGLRTGPKIALVFGHGTIVPGSGSRSTRGFAADRIQEALEQAAESDDVRAIVLRIDSGGGSGLASDQLWREVQRIREEIPVVVSMGNAAASGGYYIASGASAIVAQPSTITGSIGVYMLRPSFGPLYEKLDIRTEIIARGDYAPLDTSSRKLTDDERERLQLLVDSFYTEFLDRVATGREMATEAIDSLGQGRVWLGDAALARGLVDAHGGLHKAVELAKAEAGIEPEADPQRVVYPPPPTFAEQLQDLLSSQIRAELPEPIRWPARFDQLLALREVTLACIPPFWLDFD